MYNIIPVYTERKAHLGFEEVVIDTKESCYGHTHVQEGLVHKPQFPFQPGPSLFQQLHQVGQREVAFAAAILLSQIHQLGPQSVQLTWTVDSNWNILHLWSQQN